MATKFNGAACYFCLGEETDNEGKPLLRDCSCRGDSAGFAYLSCLTKYAEQKWQQAGDGYIKALIEPLKIFNNCKQPFQNQLAIDLVSAFVSYAEAVYDVGNNKWDKLKVMFALHLKIISCTGNSNDYNHFLSMVDQTKKDLTMSRWIHMP